MKRQRRWLVMCMLMTCSSQAMAIPPLISGDVPTASLGTYEFFVGHVFEDDGRVVTQAVPFWELVYGLTARQELTIEAPVVHREGSTDRTTGLGDAVIGTKMRLLGEPAADAGLSVSVEIKIPTGDSDRGLGSGEADVDLRARCGWQVRSETVYMNVGHTWLGDPGGNRANNSWFYAAVWDHPLGDRVRLLTEVYGKTSGDPDAPNRLAATAGIKWKYKPAQQIQFSIGRSLRNGAEGGPSLRLYTGWRRDF